MYCMALTLLSVPHLFIRTSLLTILGGTPVRDCESEDGVCWDLATTERISVSRGKVSEMWKRCF